MNESGTSHGESDPGSSNPSGPPDPQRRNVLNWLLGGSAFLWLGSIVYPVIRYLIPPADTAVKETSVKVGKVADYAKNSGTLFRIGSKPGILLRTPTGEFRAFVAVCSHLDCTVQFKGDEGVIWCACHNGKYNLHGINISGPPPRPLTSLQVDLKGDEVYVSIPS